jgi:hypothetical protein
VGIGLTCCKAGSSSNLGSAPQGGFITELTSDEEMEKSLSEWRRMNVLYACDGMNVCNIKYQNKQKEWHPASKPFFMKNLLL